MLNQTDLFINNQSTSIKEARMNNDQLFMPFSSTNISGSTSIVRSSLTKINGLHRTESLTGLDKYPKNDILTISNEHSQSSSSSSTIMKSTISTSFLFDFKPSTSESMTFNFGDNQSSSQVISSSNPPPTKTPFMFSLAKSTTTVPPKLFSTMNRSKPSSSGLFQTTIKTPIYNEEFAYLTCNSKTKVNIDRTRPKQLQLYSTTFSKSTKRKYDDDDEDENALFSKSQFISKTNIKRPRMLDMNKIRSIVLGNNETYLMKSSINKQHSIIINKSDQRAFHLPRLTHHDYYTIPAIEDLQSYFNQDGQCFVKEFTIIRKHYGSVTFQGLHMNLAGLNLDRLVRIDRRQVTIYPDENDRPDEGEELNCQAIISLIGVYPIDQSKCNSGEEITDSQRLIDMNYGKYLEEMTKKFQGHFLDYDVHTGTWSFRVDHF